MNLNRNVSRWKRFGARILVLFAALTASFSAPSLVEAQRTTPTLNPLYERIRNLPVVDARTYGVKADGVTDNYAALVSAIAAVPETGGILELPKGVIYISQKITITRGNIWLRGAGVGNTIITFNVANATNSYYFRFTGAADAHLSNVVVSDMSFDTSDWNDGTTRLNTGTVQAGGDRYRVVFAATGGTFTLSFNGSTTAALAHNASTATVQSALEGLASIGAGNVTVTGSAGNYRVEFVNARDNTPNVLTGSSSLTGVSTTLSVRHIITLAAGASATDDYYLNSTFVVTGDDVNTDSFTLAGTIRDYDGTTKEAVVDAMAAAPSGTATYGILLIANPVTHSTNGDDQVTRGVGRLGFYHTDNIKLFNLHAIQGFGWVDFRACDYVQVDRLSCTGVIENAINALSGATYTPGDTCEYFTITNCNLESGEGLDCGFDYFTITSIVWKAVGAGDEAVDLNASHYGTVSDITSIGGNHAVNFHGVPTTGDPGNASYYVTISNVVSYNCKSSGIALLYGTTSSGEQTANAGACHDITITNCIVISNISGAKGIEASWVNTTYPVRIDNVTISNCHVNTPGVALTASFSKDLTVRDCILTSTGAEAFLANHSAFQSENIRVMNCRMRGVGAQTTTGVVYFGNALRPLLQDCTITGSTQGYGVKFANCKAPRALRNEIMDAASHGLVMEWTSAANIDSDNDLRCQVVGNRIYQFGSAVTGRFGISCTASSGASGQYTGLQVKDNYVTYTVANTQSRAYNITAAAAGNLTGVFTGNEATDVFAAANKATITGFSDNSNTSPNKFGTTFGGATFFSLDGWFQEDVPASQGATEANYFHIPAGTTTLSTKRWIAPRSGSLVRVWVKTSANVSAGVLTITIYKNGGNTGFSCTVPVGSSTGYAVQPSGMDTFVQGDALSIYVTTDGSFAPVTLDLRAGLDVEY